MASFVQRSVHGASSYWPINGRASIGVNPKTTTFSAPFGSFSSPPSFPPFFSRARARAYVLAFPPHRVTTPNGNARANLHRARARQRASPIERCTSLLSLVSYWKLIPRLSYSRRTPRFATIARNGPRVNTRLCAGYELGVYALSIARSLPILAGYNDTCRAHSARDTSEHFFSFCLQASCTRDNREFKLRNAP